MQYGLCKLTPEQVRGDKVISSVTGSFTFVQDDVSPAWWPG